jgi:ferredoxin
MIHIAVDRDRCQGHGLCHMSAPELYFLRDEDGSAYVEHDTYPDEAGPQARLGEASCPERAIHVASAT